MFLCICICFLTKYAIFILYVSIHTAGCNLRPLAALLLDQGAVSLVQLSDNIRIRIRLSTNIKEILHICHQLILPLLLLCAKSFFWRICRFDINSLYINISLIFCLSFIRNIFCRYCDHVRCFLLNRNQAIQIICGLNFVFIHCYSKTCKTIFL